MFDVNVINNNAWYGNEYKRGDIVWVKFPISDGREQSGTRPALIIQNDQGNKFSPCVIVAPITSQQKKPMITHVALTPNENNGLVKESTVLTEQILTVDKKRITGKIGKVSENMIICINRAIMASLAL